MSLAHGIAEEKFLWVDKARVQSMLGKHRIASDLSGNQTPLFAKDKGLIV